MAGSRVSLVSLAGTYSTALFAMMSTPQWRTDCDQGLLVGVIDQPDPPISPRVAIFCAAVAAPLRRHCARQPTRDAVLPQTVRKVKKVYVFRPSVAKPHAVQRTNAMVALQAFRSWA